MSPGNPIDFPIYLKGWKVPDFEPDFPIYARCIVAVDPGDVHVGVSVFGETDEGWECAWSAEMEPVEFEDWLSEHMYMGRVDYLVVEEWKLFAQHKDNQVGSDMKTPQLIGAIKYIHRHVKHRNRWPAMEEAILHFQPPKIKKPTRSMLRNRGMRSVAKFLKVPNDHAQDAELHGFHYIERVLKEPFHQNLLEEWESRRKRKK